MQAIDTYLLQRYGELLEMEYFFFELAINNDIAERLIAALANKFLDRDFMDG